MLAHKSTLTFTRFLGHRKRRRLRNQEKNKTNRTYTKEFKLEALELLRTSRTSAAQIERNLGITKGLLLKWRDRYQVTESRGGAELAPSDLAAAQGAIRRLRRQLTIAEQERDILNRRALALTARKLLRLVFTLPRKNEAYQLRGDEEVS